MRKNFSNNQKIQALHRKYIWADRMRVHFEQSIQKPETKITKIESMMYMSLWYGLMYVLIECWEKLELSDPKIDKLLKSKNKQFLKDYRNATFHYNKKYNDDRFEKFFSEKSIVNWIRSLTEEYSRWFLNKLQK